MSSQNDRLRAETEMNLVLQNVIVVHHIIQVIVIIIAGAVSIFLDYSITYTAETVIWVFVFVIFCIASRCNYQDLRLILVHFNPILSTMWLAIVLPGFVEICYDVVLQYRLYIIDLGSAGVMVMLIFIGLLTLSSASFAACGIWKSARNLVLSTRSSRSDSVDPNSRFPSTQQDEPLLTS